MNGGRPWRITTQQDTRRARRWAYVIDEPGFHPYVSRYVFSSSERAMRAGERDAKLSKTDERRPL